MVVTRSGNLYTFGDGEYGVLGQQDEEQHTSPMLVAFNQFNQPCQSRSGAETSDDFEAGVSSPSSRVALIAAGGYHSIVVTEEGTLYSCGENSWGQCGHGHQERRSANFMGPVDFRDWQRQFGPLPRNSVSRDAARSMQHPPSGSSLPTVPVRIVAISAGQGHSLCVSFPFGLCFAFGHGAGGRLGLGDERDRLVPTEIRTLGRRRVRAKAVAAGFAHSLVLDTEGRVHSFGEGFTGCLGHGTSVTRLLLPRLLVIGEGCAAAAAGSADGGRTYAAVEKVVMVSAGGSHSIVVTDGIIDGGNGMAGGGGSMRGGDAGDSRQEPCLNQHHVYTFGCGLHDRLGHGDGLSQGYPKLVMGLVGHLRWRRVAAVAAGGGHSIVVTKADQPLPIKRCEVQAGVQAGCSLYQQGHSCRNQEQEQEHVAVFTFGWGEYGQLGHGDTTNRGIPSPVLVTGLKGD
jgi:alpha-tubulin suppressor-like RCC1 family protein